MKLAVSSILLFCCFQNYATSEGSTDPVYCIEYRAKYESNSLNMTKSVSNVDECYNYCKNTTNCWSWSKAEKSGPGDCSLHGINATKRGVGNVLGGEVNCTIPGGTSTTSEYGFVCDASTEVSYINYVTVPECAKLCVHTRNCLYWSSRAVDTARGDCFLYGSKCDDYDEKENRSNKVNSSDRVSGVITRFTTNTLLPTAANDTLTTDTSITTDAATDTSITTDAATATDAATVPAGTTVPSTAMKLNIFYHMAVGSIIAAVSCLVLGA